MLFPLSCNKRLKLREINLIRFVFILLLSSALSSSCFGMFLKSSCFSIKYLQVTLRLFSVVFLFLCSTMLMSLSFSGPLLFVCSVSSEVAVCSAKQFVLVETSSLKKQFISKSV